MNPYPDIAKRNGSTLINNRCVSTPEQIAPQEIELEAEVLSLILGRRRRNSFLNRLFDICFAYFCIALNLPLMLLIALAIKLESRGPVLFKQTRVGQDRRKRQESINYKCRRTGHQYRGRPITIYKFRTMRTDADPYAVSPQNGRDARITRVGRFLRATCLDELPQFFSVLNGDMSIVGPRPEMPFIVDHYGPRESLRLMVKPGITGLWQLKGSRTRLIHEDISHDFEYILKRSLWMDIKIIFWTVVFIFRHKNA